MTPYACQRVSLSIRSVCYGENTFSSFLMGVGELTLDEPEVFVVRLIHSRWVPLTLDLCCLLESRVRFMFPPKHICPTAAFRVFRMLFLVWMRACASVCVWGGGRLPSTLHSKPSLFSWGAGFCSAFWLSSWALSLLLYTHLIVSCYKRKQLRDSFRILIWSLRSFVRSTCFFLWLFMLALSCNSWNTSYSVECPHKDRHLECVYVHVQRLTLWFAAVPLGQVLGVQRHNWQAPVKACREKKPSQTYGNMMPDETTNSNPCQCC